MEYMDFLSSRRKGKKGRYSFTFNSFKPSCKFLIKNKQGIQLCRKNEDMIAVLFECVSRFPMCRENHCPVLRSRIGKY